MRHSNPILHCFILLLICSSAAAGQKSDNKGMTTNAEASQNLAFEQITIEHGLPDNAVRCILQDSHGFLWFGTPNGLARYDGYVFKVYKHNPDDSTSISHSFVYSIFEDREKTLWIGTEHGLSKFDRRTEKFTRFLASRNDSTGMKGRAIMAIHEDRSGNIWFANWDGHRSPWLSSINKPASSNVIAMIPRIPTASATTRYVSLKKMTLVTYGLAPNFMV
jgi:ligand-binding sensor domain-containing protein